MLPAWERLRIAALRRGIAFHPVDERVAARFTLPAAIDTWPERAVAIGAWRVLPPVADLLGRPPSWPGEALPVAEDGDILALLHGVIVRVDAAGGELGPAYPDLDAFANDLTAWLEAVDDDAHTTALGRRVLLPKPAQRLAELAGPGWHERPLLQGVTLLADLRPQLLLAAQGRERTARIAAAVTGLAPLLGWWLGLRLGWPVLGVVLGALWGGGVPSLLAACAWRDARRLRGLLAQVPRQV